MYEGMTDAPSTTPLTIVPRKNLQSESGISSLNICNNSSKVLTDPKRIYGYYQRSITVENPVGNVSVTNNVWLRHGDLCQLLINFEGTAPFQYCTKIHNDGNSSTNIDACSGSDWKEIDGKLINYRRFLPTGSNSYSLVVYIKNEVSTTQQKIGIHFYEGELRYLDALIPWCLLIHLFISILAQPRSQLSVVIVPVVFTLMAVVLVVFGIAYYVQNRNQFMVEVADFNFGETQSIDSLEYKSFMQRLLDSISDVFIRHNDNDDPENSGPETSNQNYRVMPWDTVAYFFNY